MTERAVIRIGTRSSELALRQAAIVQRALSEQGVSTELVKFKTTGDKHLDKPLPAIGGKGLFTRELEVALARKRVDLCVHSLKDLPTESPPGLAIVALLEREDPRDALVASEIVDAESLASLPGGSRVGTSSLRRRSQLLALRPDLEVTELRGNVPTRLRKVDEGRVHAAILAAAGLMRLGVHQRICCHLDAPGWLPAAGQGIIAVQARADDSHIADLLAPLNHIETEVAARAERSFLQAMDGGCQVPIGALCKREGAELRLHGLIGDAGGTQIIRGEQLIDGADAERGGRALAASLRARGGEALVRALREMKDVMGPQPH